MQQIYIKSYYDSNIREVEFISTLSDLQTLVKYNNKFNIVQNVDILSADKVQLNIKLVKVQRLISKYNNRVKELYELKDKLHAEMLT